MNGKVMLSLTEKYNIKSLITLHNNKRFCTNYMIFDQHKITNELQVNDR